MQEYDELGGPEFLDLYGFKAARKFLILHDGKRPSLTNTSTAGPSPGRS